MLWGCSLAAGPGWLVKLQGKISAAKYRESQEEHLIQSIKELQHERIFISQQDNEPIHTEKPTYRHGLKTTRWIFLSGSVKARYRICG